MCVCACTALSRTERDTAAPKEGDRKSVTFSNLDALHETTDRMSRKASSEEKPANPPRSPPYFRKPPAEFKTQTKH